jgi:ABC-type branched-subunit amino acid transport system ATPase component/branched-subunit amino acid ABC-type transport system permease component
MQNWLLFALLGLGLGSMYAGLGTGVVVTYKGTGVINFATGAMAMWGAFVCDELRRSGDLVFPVIGIPDRVHLGDNVATSTAVLLALASALCLGFVLDYLVIRRLSRAPALARAVATLGLMSVFQGLSALKFGSASRVPKPILPNALVRIGALGLPRDRIILSVIVVVVGGLLWAWFRHGSSGLAIVAAAENEQAAAFAGLSPQRLARLTWVLSMLITTLVVTLASPITNLDASTITLMIVPALAVSLMGSLKSVPITIGAGLVLGALQSCLTLAKTKSWFPTWARQGVNEALPFLLVVLVLFLLGRSLPERGSATPFRLPPVVIPKVRARSVVLGIAIGVAAVLLTSGSYRFGLITSMIAVIIALSLVLLTGMVGQISLAQAAFAGASGFALSKIDSTLPFPVSLIVAALLSTVLGVIVGLPALRIRGAQLAVVTLAAAVAIEQLVFSNPDISPTGGNPISGPTLFGIDLSVRRGATIATARFGLMVLLIMLLVIIGVANLMRSSTGRRFLTVRANERAGASLGVHVSGVKLTAFALSSFLAGLGGALIGYSRQQLSPASFGVFVGISMLAFAYLGGITSVSGALLAGLFAPLGIGYVFIDRVIGPRIAAVDKYYFLLGGASLVANAVLNPVGIAGGMAAKREQRSRRRQGIATLATGATAPRSSSATIEVDRLRQVVGPDVPLKVSELTVRYGGVMALDSVNLEVRRGQVVGLIGPNGAGKTTLIDAVTGYTASTGVIQTGEVVLNGMPAHRRANSGVVRTWQTVELFDELTVRENVMIGAERSGLRAIALDLVRPLRPRDSASVEWALDLVGLTSLASSKPADLSLGHQKLLGVARALAMRPTVLLLDEPAAGLDTAESALFGRRLRAIIESGVSVLLIDHDMGLILDVCDELYVLDFGRLIAQGTPASVRADAGVIDAYLGALAESLVRS